MKTLVDKVKNGAKTLAVGAAVGLATLAYSPKAEATVINSFRDFIDTSTSGQDVEMEYGDNLMIRDLETGMDSVVEKDGSVWRMGFVKYDGANMLIGGYANNDNDNSDNYPGYEGWCAGGFYGGVFADGDVADDVLVVHDGNGDGMGEVIGSTWYLGSDDTFYWTEDIEFNGVQGDISELGTFDYDKQKILPHMVVNPIPEPATIGLLGLGAGALALKRKRKYV